MRSNESSAGITRVAIDGHQDVELAHLQVVMERIQRAVRQVVPPEQRAYIGNALLNLAVCHMVRETGSQRTATILIRLVDSVLDHEPPSPEAALDLTATHS